MKWSIVNTQEDRHIVWVCKFPINSVLATRFAAMIGCFAALISKGVLGKGNTVENDYNTSDISLDGMGTNEPNGILTTENDDSMCPTCGNLLCVVNITAYDNRIECRRCGYFIVRDVIS